MSFCVVQLLQLYASSAIVSYILTVVYSQHIPFYDMQTLQSLTDRLASS
ncbi:hypothetical protein QSI_4676 [Clostridioides difficile P28]|nr:hypothetical protein QSI_4676 [Clostridioides difficile P28]